MLVRMVLNGQLAGVELLGTLAILDTLAQRAQLAPLVIRDTQVTHDQVILLDTLDILVIQALHDPRVALTHKCNLMMVDLSEGTLD